MSYCLILTMRSKGREFGLSSDRETRRDFVSFAPRFDCRRGGARAPEVHRGSPEVLQMFSRGSQRFTEVPEVHRGSQRYQKFTEVLQRFTEVPEVLEVPEVDM